MIERLFNELSACVRRCTPGSLGFSLSVFTKLFGLASLLLCLIAVAASAGDAVAIGYNYDGAWTAVTYNRSSTPKGGPNYHDATKACQFAVRDLWARASEYLVRTEIVGQSDRTGYVAVAQGKAIERDKDVTAVGRGKSQNEADANALKLLTGREATTEPSIVYRYFSYGSDSSRHSHSKRQTKRIATSQITKRRT
ncbi:MAG TPA: hypothetical protein VJR28_06685 [Chthoniobacterales bacterium]|nr:hypothetical protein [Chthoniobacterales bacterium]